MTAQDPTRTRLLEAAGEEFAAKGFTSATVREICQKADANVSAVNYYFGDKQQLYNEAVLEAHRCGSELLDPSVFEEGTPAEQLRHFIHFFMTNVLAVSRNDSWHHSLMLREMIRPTEACEAVVREAIRPKYEGLIRILRRICPAADARRLDVLAFSVVGQCLHYRTGRAISERLIGTEAYESLDVAYLSEHISRFCLAALGQAPPFGSEGEPGGRLAGESIGPAKVPGAVIDDKGGTCPGSH